MNAATSSVRRLRQVVIVVAIALAGLSALPGDGVADATAAATGSTNPAGESVVDSDVTHALESSGHVDMWVRFPAAELTAAARVDGWAERGEAVVAALQTAAEQRQADLLATLDSRGVEYDSYWAVNAVLIPNADRAVLDLVTTSDQVVAVQANGSYALPQPTEGEQTAQDEGVAWGVGDINAPQVWDTYTRGEGVVVASIDSGVEGAHPALVDSYRGQRPDGTLVHDHNWYDATGRCGAPANGPCDDHGHGTHTMGTIVGDAPGEHIGVAPGAQWIAVKACADTGCHFDDLAAAGQWILAPTDLAGEDPDPALRPHVVNNSWGNTAAGHDEWYREMVQAWVASGIVPTFAAGNIGGCYWMDSPASYPEAFAVGAYHVVDGQHVIAPFSSGGPSPLSSEPKPDITAPGVNVRSAWPQGLYAWANGTSMATPHVTGTVALVLSAAPGLVGEVGATRALLEDGAIDMAEDRSCGGEDHDNNVWGEGRLDALAAVDAAPRGPLGAAHGSVTNRTGAPLTGVTVTLSGETTWTATTDDAGVFALPHVPVGDYTATVSSYGHLPTDEAVTISEGVDTPVHVVLDHAPRHVVTGSVEDVTPVELQTATVTVLDTPIEPVPIATDGTFRIEDVPAGTHTISIEAGGCVTPITTSVEVNGDAHVRSAFERKGDDYGHTCSLVEPSWIEATQQVNTTRYTEVDLPFPVRLYGTSYTTAWMTSAGYVTFDGPTDLQGNQSLPSPAPPNATVYPFWGRLITNHPNYFVDTVGEAPNRTFVMEWRNVRPNFDTEVSFEVLFHEDGDITFQYRGIDPTSAVERGGDRTVGIESAAGADALLHSHDLPILADTNAVNFTLPQSGVVSGTITDANDGEAVVGAEVVLEDPDGTAVRRVVTDAAGVYEVQAELGEYVIDVTAPGYEAGSGDVAFDADRDRRTVDMQLSTGHAEVAPAGVDMVALAGDTSTAPLVLSNDGSTPLTWEAVESPSSTVAEPGQVVSTWAPGTSNADAVAVVGEHLWVYDETARTVAEFEADGTPTGRVHDTPWVGAVGGDLAYDSTNGLLCQLAADGSGYRSTWIACWDPATGVVAHVIGGAYQWAELWGHNGLAHDPATDTFLLSVYDGAWSNDLVRVGGLSHATPGEPVKASCPVDFDNLQDFRHVGLAWDASNGVAWLATRTDRDLVYGIDAETCQVVAEIDHPDPGYRAGGIDIDASGDLWTVDVGADEVYRQATGRPVVGDVPWLRVSRTSGTLQPDEQGELVAEVDTTGLEPGVHDATVLVSTTDAARTPTLLVPVRVVVSAHRQGVDVGGRGVAFDSQGRPWTADQRYTGKRTWGRESGQAQPRRTRNPIANTTDDQLYQTALRGDVAYRFDDLPTGTYDVELHLAEIDGAVPDGRVFDVLAGNRLLVEGVDVAAEVGPDAAYVVHADVEAVAGQPLRLRLVAQPGSAPPLVGAIHLTHRPDH